MIVPLIGLAVASNVQRELVLAVKPDKPHESGIHPFTIMMVICFCCCCPLCFLLGIGSAKKMGKAFMEPNRDTLAYFKGVITIITFSVFGYMGLF